MTFEEKLKNSEILDDGYIEKGKEVKNKKNRYIGIILALLLAAYTIYINISKYQYLAHIIETDSHQLDDTLLIISFIAIGLKLILSFFIAFYKKSIYAMNHFKWYRAIEIVSSLVLIVIFSINMYNYITILDIKNNWDPSLDFLKNLQNLSFYDKKSTFFFIVTIVINIPLLFKVLIFSFKNGGIVYLSLIISFLFPIFIIKYIKNTKDIFYEFDDVKGYNGKYYLIRKRKITIKNYVKDVKMDKFVSLLIVIALIFVAVRFSFKGANNESVFWLVFLGISGFVSNLIYFFDLRINMHLDSLGKKLKKSLEHDELKRD